MSKKILIDTLHPEETRVVLLGENKLIQEFNFETTTKSQLKGNLYLAKVARIEPSLQAAFVDYGHDRHGFIAFNEIHPDYYRIPVGDRPEDEITEDEASEGEPLNADENSPDAKTIEGEKENLTDSHTQKASGEGANSEVASTEEAAPEAAPETTGQKPKRRRTSKTTAEKSQDASDQTSEVVIDEISPSENTTKKDAETIATASEEIEEIEEIRTQQTQTLRKKYKIQEVIHKNQILLVQVVREERGNKGAALTTHISLAGRYCVLMTNNTGGGGISRRISDINIRKKLKKLLTELEVPEGMSVIIRTAGHERTKAEIKRDLEYVLRLWNDIRQKTMGSTAPSLIHEEANLLKRSIRDLYNKEVDEIVVAGEQGYKDAKALMKQLLPSHAKKVTLYKSEKNIPIFTHYQVEQQLADLHSPSVNLKSGGSIVIHQTEALVAIDVNSGRSTKERHIDDTALKTNLEAAEEIARQLHLRDLAGLIVIDFIDMSEQNHIHKVEQKLKENLKSDHARIQVGSISSFGLLEMSRQRLNPSILESTGRICPTCKGVGYVKSTESTVLEILREVEKICPHLIRKEKITPNIKVEVVSDVAIYALNHKRNLLSQIEENYDVQIVLHIDDKILPTDYHIQAETDDNAPISLVKKNDKGSENTHKNKNNNKKKSSENKENKKTPPKEDAQDSEGKSVAKERNKRRRTRRRTKKQEGTPTETEATETPQEQSVQHPPQKEENSSHQESEKKPNNRRRRRNPRQNRPQTKEDTNNTNNSHTETEKSDGAKRNTPSHVKTDGIKETQQARKPSPKKETAQKPQGNETKKATQQETPKKEATPQPSTQAKEGPKKTGWWNRLIS